jgi:aminodeoxyfutalosine synthase
MCADASFPMTDQRQTDIALALGDKLMEGRRLTRDEARAIADTTDLATLGMIAADARHRRVGDAVTFVRVVELPFGMPIPDAFPPAAREVRLTGAPASAGHAVAFVAQVAGRTSGAPVTAFTLDDLVSLAGGSVAGLAGELQSAGLRSLAELNLDRDPDGTALDTLLAAGLAVPVGRWSKPPADPVAALERVRALQEVTETLRAFGPLALVSRTETPTTGYDDVKLVALTRLILDNVDHVQVDWPVHGPKLAQVALLFGASDLDRIVASDEAPQGPRRAPLEEVKRNIAAASLEPVERDGRFARVQA